MYHVSCTVAGGNVPIYYIAANVESAKVKPVDLCVGIHLASGWI